MKSNYLLALNRKRLLFKRLKQLRKGKASCDLTSIGGAWIGVGCDKNSYAIGYYTFETAHPIKLFDLLSTAHPRDPRILMAWNLLGMNNLFARLLATFS